MLRSLKAVLYDCASVKNYRIKVGACALSLLLASIAQPVQAATACAINLPIDHATGARIVSGNVTLDSRCKYSSAFVIQSSDAILDCSGAEIGLNVQPIQPGNWTLAIRSIKSGSEWAAPKNVIVKNCIIHGAFRVFGIGPNNRPFVDSRLDGIENREIYDSSRLDGHTQRLQNAAPSHVTASELKIIGDKGSPLYIGPGVTYFNLRNSQITAGSGGSLIALDSESAYNTIDNNVFSGVGSREAISVDGSAYNRIINNKFMEMANGGIYLYRNCGENGVIRHQPPVGNEIKGNAFFYANNFKYTATGINKKKNNPAVWLSARDGKKKPYCNEDDGFPFGSSIDNSDLASQNIVSGNIIHGADARLAIRSNNITNTVENNSSAN